MGDLFTPLHVGQELKIIPVNDLVAKSLFWLMPLVL